MASLLIDTCLNINSIPIDYTDVSAVVIPEAQVIKATIKIPRNLLFIDIGTENAIGLFNLKMANPMPSSDISQTASDIEHNIESVIFKDDMLLDFATKLQECLVGTLDCSGYLQLQYLPVSNGIKQTAGFGQATVRLIQHLFMKYLYNDKTPEEINMLLNNRPVNTGHITDLFINNEQGISDFITYRNTGYDTSNAAYYTYIQGLLSSAQDTSSANIVNRLVASINTASTGSSSSGLTSVKLKQLLANFIFQDLVKKLHDRTLITNSTDVYPVQFDIGDKLYFTIDLTNATIVGNTDTAVATVLPNQLVLGNLTTMGAPRIYFEVIVGDDVLSQAPSVVVTFKISNLEYSTYNSSNTTITTNLNNALIDDLAALIGYPKSLITITNVRPGSLIVDFTVAEYISGRLKAADAVTRFNGAISSGALNFSTFKKELVKHVAAGTIPDSFVSEILPKPWITSISGFGNTTDTTHVIIQQITDLSGNIYILGKIDTDTLTFEDSHSVSDFNYSRIILKRPPGISSGALSNGLYIAKMSSSGHYQWVTRIIVQTIGTINMVQDSLQNIYLCYMTAGTNVPMYIYSPQTSTNSIVIAYSTPNSTSKSRILVKFNQGGLYERYVGLSADTTAYYTDICPIVVDTSDNYIYTYNASYSGQDYRSFISKYNSVFSPMVEYRVLNSNVYSSYPTLVTKILVDSLKNVYLFGNALSNGTMVWRKFSNTGTVLWTKVLLSQGVPSYLYISDALIDNDGNLFITLSTTSGGGSGIMQYKIYDNTYDFSRGTPDQIGAYFTISSSLDIRPSYILKIKPDGQYYYKNAISYECSLSKFVVDSNQDLYVTGYWKRSIASPSLPPNFVNSSGTTIYTIGVSGLDGYNVGMFITKIDKTTGYAIKSFPLIFDPSTSSGDGYYLKNLLQSVCIDSSNNLLIYGAFSGGNLLTCYSPINTVQQLTVVKTVLIDDTSTLFFIKYDIGGNLVSLTNISGQNITPVRTNNINNNTFNMSTQLQIDISNSIYISCNFSQSINGGITLKKYLPTIEGVEQDTIIGKGVLNGVVLKLDSSSNIIWSSLIGDSGIVKSFSMHMTNQQTILTTSQYNTSVDILAPYSYTSSDPSSDTVKFTVLGNNSADILLTKHQVDGNCEWATTIGGIGIDYISKTCTDLSNNMFVSGKFTNNVSFFNAQTSVIPKTNAFDISGGVDDLYTGIFISKYGLSGNCLWVSKIICLPPDAGFTIISYVTSQITDSSGNLYIYIYSNNSSVLIYDPQTSTIPSPVKFNITSAADCNIILKYDPSGNCCWASKIKTGGYTNANLQYELLKDSLNNIYATGCAQGSILNFYNPQISTGSASNILIPSIVASDSFDYMILFVAKYNQSGQFQWVIPISCQPDYGLINVPKYIALTIDNLDNLYITGNFGSENRPLIIYTQTPSGFIESKKVSSYANTTGPNCTFLAKCTTSGNCMWVSRIVNCVNIADIGIDISGNVYMGCYNVNNTYLSFSQPSIAVINPSTAFNIGPSPAITYDILLLKYDSSGNCKWCSRIAGTGKRYPVSIRLDSFQNIYLSGYYNSASLSFFNPQSSSVAAQLRFTVGGTGSDDIFLAKYNQFGVCEWVSRLGGVLEDRPVSLDIDKQDSVYLYGYYSGNIIQYKPIITDQSPTESLYTTTHTDANKTRMFIAKYIV